MLDIDRMATESTVVFGSPVGNTTVRRVVCFAVRTRIIIGSIFSSGGKRNVIVSVFFDPYFLLAASRRKIFFSGDYSYEAVINTPADLRATVIRVPMESELVFISLVFDYRNSGDFFSS